MKKILLSVLVIGATLMAVAGATGALFSSTAGNNGNTFAAGTLILTINTLPGTTSTPVFTVADAAPGYTETQVLALQNTGTIGASSLYMTDLSVTDTVVGGANLGDVLDVYLWEDTTSNGTYDPGETVYVNHVMMTAESLALVGTDLNLGALAASQTRNFAVQLTFSSGAGNEYQGEGVAFDFSFQANQ